MTGLDIDKLAIRKVRPASLTGTRAVHDDLVGGGDLSEMPSLRAGLLARLSLLGSALLAVRDRRLCKSLCGRWPRGVAGVATDALLQIGETRLELGDALRLLAHHLAKRSVLLERLFVGGLGLLGMLRHVEK